MTPPPSPTKTLHDLDTAELLRRLGSAREAAGRLEAQLRRRSIHRGALEAFRAEVDELAGLITGDRTYFHGKPHT